VPYNFTQDSVLANQFESQLKYFL